jgi:hypothetical protein
VPNIGCGRCSWQGITGFLACRLGTDMACAGLQSARIISREVDEGSPLVAAVWGVVASKNDAHLRVRTGASIIPWGCCAMKRDLFAICSQSTRSLPPTLRSSNPLLLFLDVPSGPTTKNRGRIPDQLIALHAPPPPPPASCQGEADVPQAVVRHEAVHAEPVHLQRRCPGESTIQEQEVWRHESCPQSCSLSAEISLGGWIEWRFVMG